MSYRSQLEDYIGFDHLPEGLKSHINGDEIKDVKLEYKIPQITEEIPIKEPKRLHGIEQKNIRLPARINNPIIPYGEIVQTYIRTGSELKAEKIHSHHHSHLKILASTVSVVCSDHRWNTAKLTFEINDLKSISKFQFSKRTNMINLAALAFAKSATTHDISIAAGQHVNFQPDQTTLSPYMSFLTMIHRLRTMITSYGNKPARDVVAISDLTDEARFTYYKNGTYSYAAESDTYQYILISAGGHFRFYHSALGKWFCGTQNHLDYAFTVADVLNNLDIISSTNEYSWARPFFLELLRGSELDCIHNDMVDFMKGLEGFMLNISDYDESYAMNWRPISEAAYDLWILDKRICKIDYDYGNIMELISRNIDININTSFLMNIIKCLKSLTRTQIQELSSLHKFIFYAEINPAAGVRKFLERVHTRRPIDKEAVKNLVRLAKQMFVISYNSKHRNPPNLEGNDTKRKLLEVYLSRGDRQSIESLPLSWWDDITIFNCMDNTLTNDALEFAKDKGALKKEVHLGPGDSRKELLQVIEQPEYILKDFFSTAPFIPKQQRVIKTSKRKYALASAHPVRLIEKEREQKWMARLFANGELSDKHALSLVATQMKKALSYFDEQLMTPTDKKRKELLHLAAQSLSDPKNYSLLLDIEGHNQSMQASNTAELAEFVGNLFGERGWATIPDYFSQIDIYHYDEFVDDVTLSTGQFGGIEGWLNPLWTLHTTLMMKLVRQMTDVVIPTIMVYSDDVNAIIEITQATEATVQSVFNKIIKHCQKFGMLVKFSQTNLSKHRVTMLRQHYSDGVRADSTLKKLISTSAANNPMLYSDELEASGISSSIASALEMSNHSETCAYLKNYKLGLLTVRLPHMMLSQSTDHSILSTEHMPQKLNSIMYYLKDDKSYLLGQNAGDTIVRVKNDVANYLGVRLVNLNQDLLNEALHGLYGTDIKTSRFIDSPDRMLYLQIYDKFLQDLQFFWMYLPASIGGIGASLHLNLILSGHSSGFSKAIHYLHQWITKYSCAPKFFLKYLEVALSVDLDKPINKLESRALLSNWPNDITICTANTSVQQSIKSMVTLKTRNKEILKLIELGKDREPLQSDMINIFRDDFHPRVAQFYYENTSVHFIDLLINKIETSSGLLLFVKNLIKLRSSLAYRTIENLRLMSRLGRHSFGELDSTTDTVEYLLIRKQQMFPAIQFVKAEEVLYDNRMEETDHIGVILTVRNCSPKHYVNGRQVFDTPHVGNEVRYKGEYLDDDRMLGNKEEFLAAKLVAVTKWFLMKHSLSKVPTGNIYLYNCVIACNIALSTLTGQTFDELELHTPTEVGGEILHRIPNIRFSTSTYIRSEMNISLTYTSELNQELINTRGLVDSNINFDYLRMRYLVAAIVKDKYINLKRLVIRYKLKDQTGIKDVQFLVPKLIIYRSTHKYLCYGLRRGHKFSELRFRYMSASYLNMEDIKEMSLIPNMDPSSSIMQIGTEFIQDLIYRYARALDRDYMRIMPEYIDIRLWTPLINRLKGLDKKYHTYSDNDWLLHIRDSLSYVLNSRKRVTTVAKDDRVRLTLQNQCLESLKLYRPIDREYNLLQESMIRALKFQTESGSLESRLKKYQSNLTVHNEHRRALAITLIIEYIIYFHFHTDNHRSMIQLATNKCIREVINEGLRNTSLLLLCPELQIQMILLGQEFVRDVLYEDVEQVRIILDEISEDNILSDIIMPGSLPSLKSSTTLDGSEAMPGHIHEIIYSDEMIPYSAMETLSEIRPLCDYAHKCSTSGATPYTFTSITGSDSLIPQVGLYKLMKEKFSIDRTTKICDLTGGRGDFQYACRALSLNATTYSRRDTFTNVYHHPNVRFDTEYDIGLSESIKFITNYDVVHVDISFTGSERLNILDLILLLEMHNIVYTIRLNSVILDGYNDQCLTGIPRYNHSIAFPSNRDLKPYQIYLIGWPADSDGPIEGQKIKSTIAFRSIALSYSTLLSSRNYKLKLEYIDPNSLTIYFPEGDDLNDLFIRVAENSLYKEKIYYAKRLLSEIGDDFNIYWVLGCLNKFDAGVVTEFDYNTDLTVEGIYRDYSPNNIGNVSVKSYPYHLKHLQALQDDSSVKIKTDIRHLPKEVLQYFRIHHPLAMERTRCNIILGCQEFLPDELNLNLESVEQLIFNLDSRLNMKDTLNQKEIQFAMKLLIVAASFGDYTYGIEYCHERILDFPEKKNSYVRILRSYRLISCFYDSCEWLIISGEIGLKESNAIQHDLEVKEKQKKSPRRINQISLGEYMDIVPNREIVDITFNELFSQLEFLAINDSKRNESITDELLFSDETGGISMSFDIGLEKAINDAIVRLRLSEPNKHGIIDLGDNYDEYDPDDT
jgi:hypothetical protein